MIRRGLQIVLVVGITAVGAAPCFGQAGTTNFPTKVTLQGFPVADHNGLFVMVGTTGVDGGYLFQRYETGTPAKYWVSFNDQVSGNQNYMAFYTNYPSVGLTSVGRVYYRDFGGASYPASVTGAFQQSNGAFIGSAQWIFSWDPIIVDPYEEAFPDWDSAAVKIPLGFTLGIAAWASFVALGIPIRWVKELTSAAS